MKKILSLLIGAVLLIGASVSVFADEITVPEFEITADGEITAYYGESYVYIPAEVNGVKVNSIGEKAFCDLGISSVTIENGVQAIGNNAFEGSNLMSLDIPASVTHIGDEAFMNCQNLHMAMFSPEGNIPAFGENAFDNTPNMMVYVYCTTDMDLFYDAFAKAKGNYEFVVETIHGESIETVEQRGDYKIPVSTCSKCGYSGVYYPGTLGIPFQDVKVEDWFYQYVDAAYHMGIINGKSADHFDPFATMTCAEAAKIAAGIAAMRNGHTIPKSKTELWYEPYVDYCYQNYVIEEGKMFDWEAPITRGQMAYLFCRADAENYYPNEVPITDIPDVAEDHPYAVEILELYDRGVAVGDETMSFHPEDPIKRSEAAAIVARILYTHLRVELPKG